METLDTVDALRTAILANHRAFLASHRGHIEHAQGLWRCVSERREFCFAVVTSRETFARNLEGEGTLYVPSWLEIPPRVDVVFQPSHSLTYMLCTTGQERADPAIAQVQTRAQMEGFAIAQNRGFSESEEDYAEWKPWIGAADHRNLDNPLQDFFVSYQDGAPAACSLTVYSNSIAGIYGVATVPAARRHGRAGALLRHAAAAAALRGFSILGLQTVTGSDAERLYLGIGFRPLFHMRVLQRRA